MPSWQKLAWIFICLTFNWVLEFASPLFKMKFKLSKHLSVNFMFLLSSLLINLGLGLATVKLFQWSGANNFGLFYQFDTSPWVVILLSVLILDFLAQYMVHYFLHKISWMWRYHMVHHADEHVGASTGTRLHPGDYIIRELVSLLAVFLLGIPLAFYVFYRILTIFFTYFTHANIKLPKSVDKGISLVFISPNMHKFHHHFERPWTDTNFGSIFSFWDRIFGTFVYSDPQNIKYGLDVLEGKNEESISRQFKIPFDKSIKTDTSE